MRHPRIKKDKFHDRQPNIFKEQPESTFRLARALGFEKKRKRG